jgi:hypothetical protein
MAEENDENKEYDEVVETSFEEIVKNGLSIDGSKKYLIGIKFSKPDMSD